MQSTTTSPLRRVPTRRALRLAVYAAIATLLVVAFWFGWRAYHVYQGIQRITSVKVALSTVEPQATPVPFGSDKRINFLVLGSDNDRKKEESNPLTQSMIVVTVDSRHNKVGILSIPRDFYVPIRGHGKDKIMLAFKYGGVHGGMEGGVRLARETVERNFGIKIDYYAWVGLDGFIRVINTFGGVTLDIKHPVLDDFYPDDLNAANPYAYRRIFISAGWQHMNGDRALQYVRSRHGDLIGDFSRSARQQQVLLELHHHINALDVLMNIETLVNELQGKVLTDLSLRQLYDLGQLSRRIKPQDINQVVLQYPQYSQYGTATTPAGPGQSVLIPTWSKIRPLVRSMFADVPKDAPKLEQLRPPAPTPTPSSSGGPKSGGTSVPPHSTPVPTATPTQPGLARLPGHLVEIQGDNIVEIDQNGNSRTIATVQGATMISPSSDGRQIAFIRFVNNASDVWTVDVRSGRLHRLTYNESKNVHNSLWDAWPTWTPDGKHLLVSTDRAKLTTPPSETRSVDLAIWSMGTDGALNTRLTTPQTGSGGDTEATTRPGTTQFAYVRWDYLKPSYQPYSQLELKDARSGQIWNLTPVGGRILQPQWNRQGTKLVFIRKAPNGQDQVVVAQVVNGKGGPALGIRTVIAGGRVAQPAFSSDGRWVSFLQGGAGGFNLYVSPVNGGAPVKIDAAGSNFDGSNRPVWLP